MAEAAKKKSSSGGGSSGRALGVRVPPESPLKTGVVLSDERVDFLRELAFCFLRVKTDKWNRFIGAEENQKILLDFLGNIWTNRLFFSTGPGGTLHAGDAEVRALQGVCKQLVCMQVLVCVLSNDLNQKYWPPVVCEDILRHLERLRRNVVTLRGQAEGRTLLPLPLFVERILLDGHSTED
uniref:Uncharacterized protein n=1 Tax=Oryzias latipes TaxID=8090 RepID=A0A3P9L9W1_ORYLA